MADSVYKVIELVGTSTDSWERAAAAALDQASASLRNLPRRRGEATRCRAGRQRREDVPGQVERLVQVRRRQLNHAPCGALAAEGS